MTFSSRPNGNSRRLYCTTLDRRLGHARPPASLRQGHEDSFRVGIGKVIDIQRRGETDHAARDGERRLNDGGVFVGHRLRELIEARFETQETPLFPKSHQRGGPHALAGEFPRVGDAAVPPQNIKSRLFVRA